MLNNTCKLYNYFTFTLNRTNIDNLVLNLSKTERLLSSNIHGLVKKCLKILQTKLKEDELSRKKYYIYKTLQGHILPLTNVAFDKQGKR